MNLKNKSIGCFFYENLYWIILTSFAISMLIHEQRILVCGAVILIICVSLIKSNGFKIARIQILPFLFAFYSLISFMEYITYCYPMYLFLASFLGSYVPILLIFCSDIQTIEKNIEKTYNALAVCFLLSLFIHFFQPQFYIDYLYNYGYIAQHSSFWATYFFQGVFGVTATGTLSACATPYFWCKFLQEKKLKFLVLMLLSVVTVFISGRRSAIAAAILGIIIVLSMKCKDRKFRISENMLVIGGLLLFVFIIAIVRYTNFFVETFNSVIGINAAIGERCTEWVKNISSLNLFQILWGTGFGSKSHAAAKFGLMAVTDGGFVQLFCELGLVGIILFVGIIFSVLLRIKMATINLYYMAALTTIFVFLLQSVGSNVLEFQATAPLFWISVGYCIQHQRRCIYGETC